MRLPCVSERTHACVVYLVSVDGVLLLELTLSQGLVLLLKLLQFFSWNLKPDKRCFHIWIFINFNTQKGIQTSNCSCLQLSPSNRDTPDTLLKEFNYGKSVIQGRRIQPGVKCLVSGKSSVSRWQTWNKRIKAAEIRQNCSSHVISSIFYFTICWEWFNQLRNPTWKRNKLFHSSETCVKHIQLEQVSGKMKALRAKAAMCTEL